MTNSDAPRIHLGPAGAPDWLADAVIDGGGHLVAADEADAIVWADARAVDALRSTLDDFDRIRWVQLPFAGVENFVEHLDSDRVWTCGKGVYAEPVAEMALALGLAGLRNVAIGLIRTRTSGSDIAVMTRTLGRRIERLLGMLDNGIVTPVTGVSTLN